VRFRGLLSLVSDSAPILLLVFCVVAVSLSWVQSRHDADTYLHALVSLDRYQPFYWGDNRFGMLIAALAIPVRDYAANLMFQTGLYTAALAGVAILFQTCFFQVDGGWSRGAAAACLSLAALLAVFRPEYYAPSVLFLGHPYAVSLLLVLAGVAIAYRSPLKPVLRWSLALLFLLLGFWVNASHAAVATVLFVSLPQGSNAARISWRERFLGLACVGAAAASVLLFARQYPSLKTVALAGPSLWLDTASRMSANVTSYFIHPWVFGGLLLLGAAALAARRERWIRQETVAFVLAAAATAAGMSSLEWLRASDFHPRYWLSPILILAFTACGLLMPLALRGLERATGSSSFAHSICGLILAAAVVQAFGLPSYSKAKDQMLSRALELERGLQELECTHIVGDYWSGWAAVFRRRALEGRKSNGPWALTLRAEATQPLWSAVPEASRRYCSLCGSAERDSYLRYFGLPPMKETRRQGQWCALAP